MEGVFLVSRVVKTVFWRFKKKEENFFIFHHEPKELKPNFVVVSKSPVFLPETLRICSITSWLFVFSP